MKLKIVSFIIISLVSIIATSQNFSISGSVTDGQTGEELIGATVIYGKGKGTSTDLNGEFSFDIQKGVRSIIVSYVGYKQWSKSISFENNGKINIKLYPIELSEVNIIADIAIDCRTSSDVIINSLSGGI